MQLPAFHQSCRKNLQSTTALVNLLLSEILSPVFNETKNFRTALTYADTSILPVLSKESPKYDSPGQSPFIKFLILSIMNLKTFGQP